MIFYLLAEGQTEECVASKLLPFCGHELSVVYGNKGASYVRLKAPSFRALATEATGLLILTDFRDADAACVPDALENYLSCKLSQTPKTLLLRFAVNEIESWLMADREGMAKFLGVTASKIPHHPENEAFPKQSLVSIARSSSKKKIREGFAPPPGHRSNVGPEYMTLIQEFIRNTWNIEVAIKNAQSLERCVHRLRSL